MSEPRNIWKGLLWACLTWLIHFVVLFVIFVAFVFCVPQFIFLYDKLDMELPAITVSFIRFSDAMVNYWYLLVVPLFFDFAFLIGAALSGPRMRLVARVWSTALLLGTILLLGTTFLAISLPFKEYADVHADDISPAPGSPLGN